ncbi:MAG: GYF domain-containing protein [Treponema sp.]|jgi:membrane protease subunit (stomatin/prohibitin family)|nr:GYF domain-containing protein [Treponema sp.]
MALFGKKGGLLGDLIQSPEQDRDWLIYKWRPEGRDAGDVRRENTILLSSPLRVRQGEVAIFQYQAQKQQLTGRSGQGLTMGGGSEDFIAGPFDATLKTANLPILNSIQGLLMGGGTSFPASVYFINTAGINQVKFGVPYFDMFDPRLPDHPVQVAVRGTITFRLVDYRQFISLHALVDFDMQKFEKQIRDMVISRVQDVMMDVQNFQNMTGGKPLIQINTYRRNIASALQGDLAASLGGTFGVNLTELNISAIEIDQEGEGYARLARLTKDMKETQIETQAEIALDGMRFQHGMNKENAQAMMGIQHEHMQDAMARGREEAQYAQRMQTDMGGFALHQLKQQEEIAKAAAGAMGQMGQGAGVNMGGGGFNPGAMMAGMAMGGAVGQGMAGMMGNVFNQMGQMPGQNPPPMPGTGAPPPVPGAPPPLAFSVAVNGQTYGPYDMAALQQMVAAGQFNAQSMVWRQGMADWQAAGAVPELAQLFAGAGAPPPPSA